MISRRLSLAGALVALASVGTAPAHAQSDEQQIVDHATTTINDMRTDQAFGTAKELIRRARAILIVPNIFKAGFFFGGEGGNGVLLVRGPHGWSDPAFYTMGSASFGLQIGAQVAETVMFIMSEKALNGIMQDRFKIGAEAGITAVTLGSNAQAAVTSNVNADIFVWASSSGAYVGLTLEGSLIEPRPSYNQAYYGRPVTTADIVLHRRVSSPHAARLVSAVSALA